MNYDTKKNYLPLEDTLGNKLILKTTKWRKSIKYHSCLYYTNLPQINKTVDKEILLYVEIS